MDECKPLGGGGLELTVRLVNDRTCFVALPQPILASLMAAAPRLPLPLALTPRGGGRRGAQGGDRGQGRNTVRAAAAPCFVAWAGAAANSHDIEIPLALADCLDLSEGQVVQVTARPR